MSDKTMKIRVPVLVGSNNRWAANGYPGAHEGNVDWSFMEEVVCDPLNATLEDTHANLLRVWVEVEVPVPEMPVLTGRVIYRAKGGEG